MVRPSIVYGPFSKNWSVRIVNMLLAGRLGIYEKYGEGKCNLVYIDDLIKAIVATLTNEETIGNAYNIVGPEVITWNKYFERFNEIAELPPLKKINVTQSFSRTAIIEPVRILGSFVRDHFMGPVKKIAENIEFAKRMMKRTEVTLKTNPSH